MSVILETEELWKTYRMGDVAIHALRGVELIVEQGEFLAVMGPSGSGKSTLLHLIAGLQNPSRGEVVLAGQQLGQMTDGQVTLVRRRQVGFVFQFFNLLPTLTAAENVALPLLMDGQLPPSCAARVAAVLTLVDMRDRSGHRPDQLSGGEQQRVAIARALVTEPVVILADEPTGNLDTGSGRKVLNLMRRACEERSQTIVIVTHDPRCAAYADRVVFLWDGRVVRELKLEDGRDPEPILGVIAELEA